MNMDGERGRLIEKGFYFKPRDHGNLSFLIAFVLIIFGCIMVLFIGIILGFLSNKLFWVIVLSMFMLGIVMVFLIGETRYAFKIQKGVLDWDLYENGILTKKWNPLAQMPEDVHIVDGPSSAGLRQLEERFYRFDAISKVHLTENAVQNDECVRLLVRFHGTDPKSIGPLIKEERSSEWEAARSWACKSILFEGGEGRLLFNPLERKHFKDLGAFEKFIRQKVRVVE